MVDASACREGHLERQFTFHDARGETGGHNRLVYLDPRYVDVRPVVSYKSRPSAATVPQDFVVQSCDSCGAISEIVFILF